MKDLNKEFADIVWNSLEDVDELGDDILLESDLFEPRLFHNRLPTIDSVSYTHLTLPTKRIV